jgi:predicted PurR-regulated permease PerM
MAERTSRNGRRPSGRLVLDVSWRTLGRVLVVVALVWIVLALRELWLVLVVAVVLSVALDPIVEWFQRRRVGRGVAVAGVMLGLAAIVGGALVVGWSSLAAEGRMTLSSLAQAEHQLVSKVPVLRSLASSEKGSFDGLVGGGVALMQLLTSALLVVVFSYILTAYLLMEGARTYAWVRTFVPHTYRE